MQLRHMILAFGLVALAGCAGTAATSVNTTETLPPAGLHPLNTPPSGRVQAPAQPQRLALEPTGGAAPTGLGVAPLASPSPVGTPASLRPVAEPPSLHNLPPVALMPLPPLGNNPSFGLPPLNATPSPMPALPPPASTVPPSVFWQTLRN